MEKGPVSQALKRFRIQDAFDQALIVGRGDQDKGEEGNDQQVVDPTKCRATQHAPKS